MFSGSDAVLAVATTRMYNVDSAGEVARDAMQDDGAVVVPLHSRRGARQVQEQLTAAPSTTLFDDENKRSPLSVLIFHVK